MFKCPFLAVTNHGRAVFAPEEAAALRAYVQKGGFMWADDAWGSRAWDHWLDQLRQILPASDYPLVDLPLNHSIFHTLFDAQRIRKSRTSASFAALADTRPNKGKTAQTPHAYALLDNHGRIVVLTTHNTDFGDAYERESDDPEFFLQVFRRRICDRHQHPPVCDDALKLYAMHDSLKLSAHSSVRLRENEVSVQNLDN